MMEVFFNFLALLLCGLVIAFFVVCLKKDRALVGFYKSVGGYGRVRAYIMVSFLFGIITIFIPAVLLIIEGEVMEAVMTVVIGEAMCIPISFLMLKKLFNMFPDISKGRIIWDYIIIACGSIIRVEFFIIALFIKGWYIAEGPREYTTNYGQTVYAYPNSDDLYDSHGYCIGKISDDRTEAYIER